MNQGTYEHDWYTVCGANTTTGGTIYWVVWLDTGSHTGGFQSAAEARRCCDRTVVNKLLRENRFDEIKVST